jgi:hypothetical protein
VRVAPLPVLAALAAVSCAIIAAEMAGSNASEAPIQTQAALAPLPKPGAPPVDASQAQLVAALLARPPFAPDRRPDPGQGGAADSSLPHLTGILISGDDRRAIFATNEAGRPDGRSTVVREGENFGAYHVQSISAASVMLSGPGGLHTVQPRFSNTPPAAAGLAGLPLPPAPPLAMYLNGPAAPALAVPPRLGNTQ